MGLYDNEIKAAKERLSKIQEARDEMASLVENTQDPVLKNQRQKTLEVIIDDIDALMIDLERMENVNTEY